MQGQARSRPDSKIHIIRNVAYCRHCNESLSCRAAFHVFAAFATASTAAGVTTFSKLNMPVTTAAMPCGFSRPEEVDPTWD